jgi:hypothetical protein
MDAAELAGLFWTIVAAWAGLVIVAAILEVVRTTLGEDR